MPRFTHHQIVMVAIALAACGGKHVSGATEPGSPVVEGISGKPACITPFEEVAIVQSASATGTRVSYCLGSDARCFALDVATGVFERIAAPPAAGPPQAHVETTNPKVEVCAAGQNSACTPLTPKVLPNSTTLQGATNADGTVAVVLLGDAPRGKGYAEVWNVPKGKRTAMFRYARGDFRCGEVAMLDDKTIFVNAAQCEQPSARGAIYRIDGRKIANVGGKDFGTYGGVNAQVDDTTWAFLEENGQQVVIQDIVKGKVKMTVDTSLLYKHANATMGNPGEAALVRFPDGKLGLIAGAPAYGSIATIDTANGEIAIVAAPICGEPR